MAKISPKDIHNFGNSIDWSHLRQFRLQQHNSFKFAEDTNLFRSRNKEAATIPWSVASLQTDQTRLVGRFNQDQTRLDFQFFDC
jgi:hypothetical protein